MKNNKKRNNNGFTLVELLAVLVILITILTIAIPSITSSVERNKENMLNKKYRIIEAAAESYVSLYKNEIDYDSFISGYCSIGVDELEKKGLLTSDDLKDMDGIKIEGYVEYDKYEKEYVYSTSSKGECLKGTR